MTASRRRDWTIAILSGALVVAALVVDSQFGNIHSQRIGPVLITWASAVVVAVCGVVVTRKASAGLGRLVTRQSAASAGAVVRLLATGGGYVVFAFTVLAMLVGHLDHLLVGAGVAGVVLGIAAQQSLGNVFAALVLLFARPFKVGDHVRIRSGALGGVFDAWVREISLTYVTVRTEDGDIKVPNSAMLNAGVGQLPHDSKDASTRGEQHRSDEETPQD
ncbi:MAG: mechanosensitive ion channel family protein [Acidimicrobiales bacterium]|jgi:small-conductance mechanosensitive channel